MPFQFSGHSLDEERRELRRGAELIDAGPQVFDLLVYLIRKRNRVVSKKDLFDAVWKGRIVSELTLTSRINAVQRIIGDTGADRTLIETIARKGFRFVGDVDEGGKALPQPSAGGVEVNAGGLRQEIRFCTASDGVRIAYATVGTSNSTVAPPSSRVIALAGSHISPPTLTNSAVVRIISRSARDQRDIHVALRIQDPETWYLNRSGVAYEGRAV